jgi:hypothetical protein
MTPQRVRELERALTSPEGRELIAAFRALRGAARVVLDQCDCAKGCTIALRLLLESP